MKKNLVALLAVVMLSTTAVYASNPVSSWLNKTADSIESTTSNTAKSVKNEEQSWISQWKAKRAEAKAKRDAANKEVTETKNAFKRLFTWDWK